MEPEGKNEALLRRYLLGELNESDEQVLEGQLLADDELTGLVLAEEDELVDDYLGGELSEGERERFDRYFLVTPERRRKLKFAESLRRYSPRTVTSAGDPGRNPTAERLRTKGLKSEGSGDGDSEANELTSNPLKTAVAPISAVTIEGRRLWWPRAFSSQHVKAALVVIALGLGFVTWRALIYQSEVEKGMAALARAYGSERPVEARISGLGYAPYSRTRGSADRAVDTVSLDHAERILLDAFAERPGPAVHHALGEFYLAARRFEDAINQFELALKDDPDNAKLLSDFGAVYLELAFLDPNKPSMNDSAKSLQLLNRALELDGSLLAAHFNRALCLQRMNTMAAAKQAWEEYLRKDSHSEWSKEAERNLRLLQGERLNEKTPEQVLGDFLRAYRAQDEELAWRIQSQTKEMITGTMIPFHLARAFTAANLSNQADSEKEALGAFRFVGDVEKKRSGDRFFAEMAAYYAVTGKKKLTVLKEAQYSLEQGYQLCLEGRYTAATPFFEKAQNLFRRAGDAWESKVVDYWLAYCLTQKGDLTGSSALLWRLARDCQNASYHWLEAQAYCWLANNSALLGEYSEGVEQDKKALSIAAKIDDLYAVQKTSSQVAEDYKFLGRLEEALDFNRRSLPSADNYFVSRRQLWRSLFSITDTFYALRLYAAAEAYQLDALQLASSRFDDPALMHDSYMRLGQIYAGQGNYSEARRALELSLKALQPIEGEPIGKKLFGLSMLQTGNVARQSGDYTSALGYYRQAAQEFESSEFGLYNYNTHKGMLLCHLLDKDDRAIQQELIVVLNLFEQNRLKIREELSRNHFFDAEQDVYELAIEYEYGRNNTELSFHYADSSRARSLQDAIMGGVTAGDDSTAPDVIVASGSQPLTPQQLQERLPADLKLIEYAVLRNRLLIWVISKERFDVVERSVSMVALEALANDYLHVLIRNDPHSIDREKQLAAALHDWLFAPLERYLNKADAVVLVPDKFLFKVPFAALLSRESSRRVVNDYTLLYSPSASVLTICSGLAAMKEVHKGDERLLSVGDPMINLQQHQHLSALPSSAIEAKEIASLYDTRAVLVGGDASKERIAPELTRSDVIHFAAHYLTDDFLPARSRLLLAAVPKTSASETSDDLTLQEIQTMRRLKAKLVVLSACQSGVERFYAGEGLVGLSRAFLMAGIPLVVASQWSVESDSTADLMIDFHTLRKTQNLSTTQALRQAQLDMLNHNDENYRRPFYWGAFFAIGGHASY